MPNLHDYLTRNRLEVGVFLSFSVIAGSLLFFHEPWRDELQCWAIARESSSFFDLLFKARYEGHPSAWYALLYLITRVSDAFIWVRIVHLLLAAGVVWLVLFKSPFSKTQRIFFALGYFIIYEYAALSRNYILGLLLLFGVCILIKKRKDNWLLICSILFLTLQVNVFSALLACALFVVLFYDYFFSKKNKPDLNARISQPDLFTRKFLVGLLIFGAGFLLSVADMLPPEDSTFMPAWTWAAPQWQHALSSFLHAMTPVPKLDLHFWNTHILQGFIDWKWLPTIESTLAVGLLGGCVFSLRKHRLALIFFLAAWLAISVFLAVKYTGFLRHHGHFFIAYAMAWWIKKDGDIPPQKALNSQTSESFYFLKKQLTGNIFFSTILFIHMLAAVTAIYFDVKYPFTQSYFAAHFIKNNYPPDVFIAGHFDYATSPVSFHLNRPLFYPNQNKAGTFIYWSADRFAKEITDISKATGEICGEKEAFLLLTSYPLPATPTDETTFKLIEKFGPAVVKEEEYWLYEVTCRAVETSQARPDRHQSQ